MLCHNVTYRSSEDDQYLASDEIAGKDELLGEWQDFLAQLRDVDLQCPACNLRPILPISLPFHQIPHFVGYLSMGQASNGNSSPMAI